MPEKIFNRIKESFLPQWKVCLLSALCAGLITHLYKITNHIPNWDGLVFRYDAQWMIGLGRWFLAVVCSLSSFYDLPFLNGLIAILFHGFGAVCICKILNIQKKTTAFLIGALTATFPVVTSVMMYSYVADGYSIAFFFSCLAALFLTAEKPKFIPSVILIALSAAIYQAYITVTIMLLLLWLTDNLVYGGRDAGYLVKKCLVFLPAGALGLLVYNSILTAILKITGTELLEYQGINASISLQNIDIPASLYQIKETLTGFFFDFSQGFSVFIFLNITVFVLTVLIYLKYAFDNKILSSIPKVLLLVLFAALIIIGSTVLVFINPGIDYHNLMLMGYCVFYIFFVMLYERGDKDEKKAALRCWTVLAVSLVLILTNTVIANVSYHKAQMAYEKSYGMLIRIADRIEQTESAEECSEILVIGALKDSKNYSAVLPPDITGITDGYIIRADDESVGQSVLCSALNDYCGKEYKFLSGNRKKEFLENDEVEKMPLWPKKGSIAVTDGVIVIKLGSEAK